MNKKFESSNSVVLKARILAELIPSMRKFSGETFVIRFQENIMDNKALCTSFAADIVMLKQIGIHPVIVHGGSVKTVNKIFEKLALPTPFLNPDNLIIDQASMDIIEMVLSGSINKQIVSSINAIGGSAVGLSGKDGNLIESRKLKRVKKNLNSNIENIVDVGFVGEPTVINPDILITFEESDLIPIIAPIGIGENGETFYLDADLVAAAIASSLAASKLIILTEQHGLLMENGELIDHIDTSQARKMLSEGTISKDMHSKVEACVFAMERHTTAAHIIDARIEHALLLEVFTNQRIGTMFSRK